MKKMYLISMTLLSSCGYDLNEDADRRLSEMKSPVVVIGRFKNEFGYFVTVRDSIGVVQSFGNGTILGRAVGESRNIGDTIK